jgi:hypothetical protein
MPQKLIFLAVLLLALATPAQARDTRLKLDFAQAVAAGIADGTLDGSVRFYLEGQPTPAVLSRHGAARSNRKTNAFNKPDEEACRWALMSVLLAMQEQARSLGADAVVGIRSNYKGQEFTSAREFECGAGTMMAGVALQGTYAKLGGQ